jgi:hypothetical protein
MNLFADNLLLKCINHEFRNFANSGLKSMSQYQEVSFQDYHEYDHDLIYLESSYSSRWQDLCCSVINHQRFNYTILRFEYIAFLIPALMVCDIQDDYQSEGLDGILLLLERRLGQKLSSQEIVLSLFSGIYNPAQSRLFFLYIKRQKMHRLRH